MTSRSTDGWHRGGDESAAGGRSHRARSRFLLSALAVYALWTLATWLLEGWPRTLLRPQAIGLRALYDGVANVGLGIGVAAAVLARAPHDLPTGFSSPVRAVLSFAVGLALGLGIFFMSPPPAWTATVVVNGFARTFATSTAEIVVCWSLCGTAVAASLRGPRWLRHGLGAVAASVLFGVYHVAHSPPFNSPRMVLFLIVVGFVTSAFYLLTADVWGTIALHNGFAMIGVLGALAGSSRLDSYATLQPPILATAVGTALALVAAHRAIRRRTAAAAPPGRVISSRSS